MESVDAPTKGLAQRSRNQKALEDLTTERTKFIIKISETFVGFVIFVVRVSFVKCCIHE